jgi:hypothetical protein
MDIPSSRASTIQNVGGPSVYDFFFSATVENGSITSRTLPRVDAAAESIAAVEPAAVANFSPDDTSLLHRKSNLPFV